MRCFFVLNLSTFFLLAVKLIGPFPGYELFTNLDFFDMSPLNENFLLKDRCMLSGDSFCRVVRGVSLS